MKNHITKFVVAVGLFAAGLLGISRVDNAVAKSTSLRVNPTQFHLTLEPGTKQTGSFKFSNESDYAINYTVAATPYFVETGDDGHDKISYDKASRYSMITDWITFDTKEGSLDENETTVIGYTIDVPTDVPAGGQYAVMMVSTEVKKDNKNEAVNIGETAAIGPVVYATVNGETREEAVFDSHDISGFLFNPPIQSSSKITNNGNVHAEASYILRVFPFFGGESIYNDEENPHVEVIFPGTSRYYVQKWDNAPSIGIYKVESEIKVFGQVNKIERTVIICPMWVLILIIVFILAVIFWIVSRVKARKAER